MLVTFLESFSSQTVMIALAVIIPRDYSSNSMVFGLAATVYALGRMLVIFPMGKLSDKIGRKPALLLSISMSLLGLVLLQFVQYIYMILFSRFLMGANAHMGITMALIDDAFPPTEKGKPVSWLTATKLAGFLMGSVLGGNIYALMGDSLAYVIQIALVGISMLVVIICVPMRTKIANGSENPPEFASSSDSSSSPSSSSVTSSSSEIPNQNRAVIIKLLKTPAFRAILVINFGVFCLPERGKICSV
ncbi:MAG: MFS transporter [Promethearchaeota archaeon]